MNFPVFFSAKCHALVMLVTGCVLWPSDEVFAKSYALGALVYTLPNLYFVYYAFRFSNNPPLVARSLAWGESGKFVLAMLGFVAIYRFVDALHYFGLLAGFVSMILTHWFVAARIVKVQRSAATNAKKV